MGYKGKKKNEYDRQWRKDNPEKVKQSKDRYYEKNRREICRKSKEYHINHPEKVNKNQKANSRKCHLKLTYNLSPESWLEIWKYQDGKCAICGNSFTSASDAYTDHNHETDEIRGLLCRKCNFGIGLFNDNPKLLMEAIKYLK